MKSYEELKAKMEKIQHKMVETKIKKITKSFEKVKCALKEFVFTASMPKCSLNIGREEQ